MLSTSLSSFKENPNLELARLNSAQSLDPLLPVMAHLNMTSWLTST
jgi:hypothetical protein